MQIRLSPSMSSITISTSSNGLLDLMKVKISARHIPHRIFHTVLILALLLPFVFILTAFITLEGVNNCSSFVCLGRRFGPRFLDRHHDDSMLLSSDDCIYSWQRIMRDLYNLIDQANAVEIPEGIKFPESFGEFISEVKHNQYDVKTFAIMLKGTIESMGRKVNKSRIAEQLHKHFAATSVPKGLHCLSLRLTDEYSSNAHARKQLPPLDVSSLSDNSYHHFILATDNILAASVVVSSTVKSSTKPQMIVFHVITDKKTYPGMHSWFALNSLSPAVVDVKSVHQFEWLKKENVPVMQALENHLEVRNHYHGNPVFGAQVTDNPRVFASKLQAKSSKYISLLNHLRIYLPELFPSLDKVVFLDDDVVVQRDLIPLWDVDLSGKVNGAVETCKGDDGWVMSKRFRTYFNFSHPLISKNLNPEECAWAYGMNIFDLNAWRRTQIRETYHHWLKEYLNSNLSMWRLGTLPPALIAFRGQVHPIDPSWHMLGLGYQEKSDLGKVRDSAVIHYNGQCKPWLEIGYRHLQPFWTKHLNYSNEFLKSCQVLKPAD